MSVSILALAPGLGISEATAKTHLQHIYAKIRSSRQTELVQFFARSAPP